MDEILNHTYYGNTAIEWLIALAIMLGSVVAGKLLYWVFGNVFKKLTSKSETKLDDIIVDMVEEPVALVVVLAGVWYALHGLELGEGVREFVGNAFHFVIVLNVAWLITRLLDSVYQEYLVPLADKSETDLDDQVLPIVRKGTKIIIWILATIIALNNAGYDVGAALAGLGIGGLALAMAGKDTVENMFGGLTIFMDKPFTIHDRVRVAGYEGTVEEIGLRSTRIKTLEGRIVTIPNSQFSGSPVENVTAEPTRKVLSTIGLTYDMSADQMEEALAILRKIAEEHEGTDENIIVGFSGFGDFSMNILFIYYIVKDVDIVETQTEINLAILRAFADKGLDMAFPTQTIYTKAA